MTPYFWPALLLGAASVLRLPAPGPTGPDGSFQLVQAAPPIEYGYILPSVPMDALQRSGRCETTLPTFGHPDRQYWAPQGGIAMSNDGGWCWIQFGQVIRAREFVPKTTVVDQPEHGVVTVEAMEDRVSVAYRPGPGFTGSDHFVLKTDGPLPHTIPFAVIVR